MYTPASNAMNDPNEVLTFIQRFNFGTIISNKDGKPIASHLPFIAEMKGDTIVLKSHMAKANEQWSNLIDQNILVIFTEPHAYISPKNYEKKQNVPTWNYIAVHAYGNVQLIDDKDDLLKLLEESINVFDQDYKEQWNDLTQVYKQKMIKGIVGFELTVNEVQGRKKLSQNKTETERKNVINDLEKQPVSSSNLVAEYMKRERDK